MIVVRLTGRLGNQLFQYAAARSLALRLGVDLAVDARRYPGRRGVSYSLGAFAIKIVPVDTAALPAQGRGPARLLRRWQRTPFTIHREQRFDPAVTGLPDWTYLEGYFQSERYFADHAVSIREDLAILAPPDAANLALATRIADCCAVSLHVRRGDYVTSRKANDLIGSLELDYYARAVDRIAANAGERPTFFVFSDDPDWVEANLHLAYPTVVVRQRGPAYEDLRLMAACRHHIVANSSFSWWGAWLNPSPDKIVIAPEPWFKDADLEASHIVPDGWTRVAATHASPYQERTETP